MTGLDVKQRADAGSVRKITPEELLEAIKQNSCKRTKVITIARTLHTYTNTLKILCQATDIDYSGTHFKCEMNLIEEAYNLKRTGNRLIILIDDAHLMEMQPLRRIRHLLEDFPKNYNLILLGQPGLLHAMNLRINDDIKSRVTWSCASLTARYAAYLFSHHEEVESRSDGTVYRRTARSLRTGTQNLH